jgi:hypothetical protein
MADFQPVAAWIFKEHGIIAGSIVQRPFDATGTAL